MASLDQISQRCSMKALSIQSINAEIAMEHANERWLAKKSIWITKLIRVSHTMYMLQHMFVIRRGCIDDVDIPMDNLCTTYIFVSWLYRFSLRKSVNHAYSYSPTQLFKGFTMIRKAPNVWENTQFPWHKITFLLKFYQFCSEPMYVTWFISPNALNRHQSN